MEEADDSTVRVQKERKATVCGLSDSSWAVAAGVICLSASTPPDLTRNRLRKKTGSAIGALLHIAPLPANVRSHLATSEADRPRSQFQPRRDGALSQTEPDPTPRRVAALPDAMTLLAFGAVVLLGGINGIAAKQLLRELDPFWAGVGRFIVAGAIMSAIVLASRQPLPRGRSLLGAMAYGALGFAVTMALVFAGLRDTPVSTAAVFLALTPLLTLGLAVAHRQEAFRLQGLVGSLLALGGVALIFVDQLSAAVLLGSRVLIALGVLSLAETGILVKTIPRSDPRATNAVAMLTAAVLLLVFSLVAGEQRTLPSQPITWLAFVYTATLGSVLLFGLFVYTLERWTASAVSYSDILIPLVTITIATSFTGEQISATFLVGGAVVVAGVFVGAFLTLPHRKPASTTVPECIAVQPGSATIEPEAEAAPARA